MRVPADAYIMGLMAKRQQEIQRRKQEQEAADMAGYQAGQRERDIARHDLEMEGKRAEVISKYAQLTGEQPQVEFSQAPEIEQAQEIGRLSGVYEPQAAREKFQMGPYGETAEGQRKSAATRRKYSQADLELLRHELALERLVESERLRGKRPRSPEFSDMLRKLGLVSQVAGRLGQSSKGFVKQPGEREAAEVQRRLLDKLDPRLREEVERAFQSGSEEDPGF